MARRQPPKRFDPIKLGEKIRELRAKQRLVDLADKAGITKSTLSAIERGETHTFNLPGIAEAFGMTADQLIDLAGARLAPGTLPPRIARACPNCQTAIWFETIPKTRVLGTCTKCGWRWAISEAEFPTFQAWVRDNLEAVLALEILLIPPETESPEESPPTRKRRGGRLQCR